MSLLSVKNLTVDIATPRGTLHAVRGISFDVLRGQTLCIVGESGCGKSMTSLALMDLLPGAAKRQADAISFDGQDLRSLNQGQMNVLRGNRMAMIFQEPMTSLNPSYTIGNQLIEGYLRHTKAGWRQAEARAMALFGKVGIANASERMGQYPHQLSGGLRQRVMIAMALMCGPDLLIADEPTTALDVTIQAQILRLLIDIQREVGLGLLLITHDLGIVARLADVVAVMYAGKIVESGLAADIFKNPRHPYTRGLIDCIPVPGKTERGSRLGAIPGVVPSLIGTISGCAFRERCSQARPACAGEIPWHMTAGGQGVACVLELA
jgi:peptide/nickel transport system ATP-binding protein